MKPRIYRVTYKATRHPGCHIQVRTVVVKVPYGGAYAMTELLTRMVTVGEVEWFVVAIAKPREIAAFRDRLQRWLPALTETSRITGVDWTK